METINKTPDTPRASTAEDTRSSDEKDTPLAETPLTQGPVASSLVCFAVPVIVSMLTAQFYSLVDTMIVGLLMDADALAAVANAATILMFFLFVSGGMELAGELLVASHKPVYSPDEMSSLIYNLLFIDAALGLIMLVLGVFTFRALLVLINTPTEIVEAALSYGTVYLMAIPFQMLYDLSREIAIGSGDSKTPLYFVLATSSFNIALDLVLVAYFGVVGAALASGIAQLLGCIGVLIWIRRRLLTKHFSLRMLTVSHMRDVARLAPPYTLQQMSGVIVSSGKQALLGNFGVSAIAGFSCAEKLSNLLLIPVFGTAQSLVTFIAQNEALGYKQRIRSGIRISYGILLTYSVFMVAICVGLSQPLMRLFTADVEVIAFGAVYLAWESLAYPGMMVRHVQEARLRGKQSMLLYLISNASAQFINIIASYMLVPRIGFSGFYISIYIGTVCSLVISLFLVRKAGA